MCVCIVAGRRKERETWSGGRGVWGGRAEKIFEEVMPSNLKIFKLDGKEQRFPHKQTFTTGNDKTHLRKIKILHDVIWI